MTDSPEIIAGLLKLRDLTNEVHDRLHDQEHLWEAVEFPKLEKVWDEANRDIWDRMHHRFLRRLLALGGRPPGVTEDPVTAYIRALHGLNTIHQECRSLYEVVDKADDYVTLEMLMKVQKEVESWIRYFAAKLGQARSMKSAFMPEQM